MVDVRGFGVRLNRGRQSHGWKPICFLGRGPREQRVSLMTAKDISELLVVFLLKSFDLASEIAIRIH